MAKEREKVEDEAAAKVKVEEAGNGRKNIHQPAFKVTIYCEYCGKRNHTAANCWKKQKDDKKQQEDWNAKQQGQPGNPKPSPQPTPKPARKPAPNSLLWQHLKRKEATKRRGSCCPSTSIFSSNARSTGSH